MKEIKLHVDHDMEVCDMDPKMIEDVKQQIMINKKHENKGGDK